MVHFQDTYTPGSPRMQDWSTEITPPGQRRAPVMVGTEPGRNTTGMTVPAQATPPALSDMQNDLPVEVIQAPTSVGEAYLGSWKALLSRYEGSYVVATFLVGTQNTVSWEGILFDVGNDYLTIYQEARDRYIVSDYYSLKFIEFYDIQRRRRCAELLREEGWQSNGLSDSMGGGMNSGERSGPPLTGDCGSAGSVVESGHLKKQRRMPDGFCKAVGGALFPPQIQ